MLKSIRRMALIAMALTVMAAQAVPALALETAAFPASPEIQGPPPPPVPTGAPAEPGPAGSNPPCQTCSTLVPRLMGVMEAGIDWVLWLLFGLGAVCLFLLIERIIYFSLYARGVDSARVRLCAFLGKAETGPALEYFKGRREIVSRVLAEALENEHTAPEALAELVDARLMHERQRLERGLSIVGTVGSNAPFIGLFGTVLGIIKAFHDLAVAEQAGPAVVMAGISEALVATAVGLLVAIPAVVIFNVFKARTRTVIAGTESVFKMLLSRQLDLCFGPAKARERTPAQVEAFPLPDRAREQADGQFRDRADKAAAVGREAFDHGR